MTRPGRFFFLRNIFGFAFSGGRLWLLPILLILIVIAVLAAVGALTPYAAFLYPL
jgi:hypothetical protein